MVETSAHIAVTKDSLTKTQPDMRWIREDELSNIIIEAFKDGEQKGKKNAIKTLVDGFRRDYDIAKKIYEACYQGLLSNGIKCHEIRVGIGKFRCFEAIFIIPAKTYYSEGYTKALEITKSFTSHPSPDISLHYRFMPFSKNINYEELESDGYIASYK